MRRQTVGGSARVVAGLVGLGVLPSIGTGGVSAQDKPKMKDAKPAVEDKAATGPVPGEGGGGTPDKNSMTPAAPTRRGAYSCDVHVDNRTSWYIHRVYIDG